MSAPTTSAPQQGPTWEFSAEQNVLLARLSMRMRFVGASLMVLAALLALWSLLGSGSGDMLALQLGLVLGLTGLWSARAGGQLSRIVRTEGADARLLMRALRDLARLYELQYWIFVLLALLAGATLVMAISGRWLPSSW